MKKYIVFYLILVILLSSCSVSDTVKTDNSTEPTAENTFPPISYDAAFDFVQECEQNIIDSNKSVGPNKVGDSAAEFIIYSYEYAGLFCAYWAALESIGEPNDSRFEKTKLRWQMDFTNEEWKELLISAFAEGGSSGFNAEYGRIYVEIVFPIIAEKWEKSLETVDYD